MVREASLSCHLEDLSLLRAPHCFCDTKLHEYCDTSMVVSSSMDTVCERGRAGLPFAIKTQHGGGGGGGVHLLKIQLTFWRKYLYLRHRRRVPNKINLFWLCADWIWLSAYEKFRVCICGTDGRSRKKPPEKRYTIMSIDGATIQHWVVGETPTSFLRPDRWRPECEEWDKTFGFKTNCITIRVFYK